MEKIHEQIDAFLGRATIIKSIIKAEMRRHEAGMLIVNQVNDSLIFVSPRNSYIYEMDYIDNYVNRAAGIPFGLLLWQDYLLKPVRECSREENPELFLEILKLSMKVTQHRAYEIYADGKHVKRVLTWGRAKRFVYALKQKVKNPIDESFLSFRDLKRIRVVDPAGNSTWFILDPAHAHYNPYYVPSGE